MNSILFKLKIFIFKIYFLSTTDWFTLSMIYCICNGVVVAAAVVALAGRTTIYLRPHRSRVGWARRTGGSCSGSPPAAGRVPCPGIASSCWPSTAVFPRRRPICSPPRENSCETLNSSWVRWFKKWTCWWRWVVGVFVGGLWVVLVAGGLFWVFLIVDRSWDGLCLSVWRCVCLLPLLSDLSLLWFHLNKFRRPLFVCFAIWAYIKFNFCFKGPAIYLHLPRSNSQNEDNGNY